MLRYHTTVTGALQTLARLARTSPYVATISAPIAKAESIAQRQAKRYPTITADHPTRTALRKAGVPAVQLVIMPPDTDSITMFLLSNVPAGERETWHEALDEAAPLTWRNYQLTEGKRGAITWRLTAEAREHYRSRIARLITGRGPVQKGKKPYQLPDESACAQVLKLAQHLHNYPGLSGMRADVFELAQYSTKVWKATRPAPYPEWPTMPYVRFSKPKTAPLSQLQEDTHAPQEEEADH